MMAIGSISGFVIRWSLAFLLLLALLVACNSAASPKPEGGQAGGSQPGAAPPSPQAFHDLVNRTTCWVSWSGDIACLRDPQ